MKKDELQDKLNNLRIHHAFGMASLIYVQPKINLLTEQEVFKAEEIDKDICSKINWGIPLEKTEINKTIINKAENITEEEQDNFFKDVYNHFGLKYL